MRRCACIATVTLLLAVTADAADTSPWILRAGVHPFQPQPHNHPLLRIEDGATLSFGATYQLAERWGMEAFAALPVVHDVALAGGGDVAEIGYVPAALSIQYRLTAPSGRMRAHVGVGINYSLITKERTAAEWTGRRIALDSSFGPTAQVGIDFDLSRHAFISFDARWFDIDDRLHVDSVAYGTLEIDPYAVGISYGRRLP
jgi:outer membrane protein